MISTVSDKNYLAFFLNGAGDWTQSLAHVSQAL